MSYFAAVLTRRGKSWAGEEIDLDPAEDLDGVIELVRQAGGDDAETTLLLVEQDDEWFAIVRLDDDVDPRVFLSDGRVVETSSLGAIFGEAASVEEPPADDDDDDDDDDEEEDDGATLAGEPLGDADLMGDLGMPASSLLKLCAEEGQLPADILSAVCDAAGCLDALEALRAV